MGKIGYVNNTFEDMVIDRIIWKEIEKEVLDTFCSEEIEILEYIYHSNPIHHISEISKQLNIPTSSIYLKYENVLKKLRLIILKHREEDIDLENGITSVDLEKIANILSHKIEKQSNYIPSYKRRHRMIVEWIKDFIVWNLSSEERSILYQEYVLKMWNNTHLSILNQILDKIVLGVNQDQQLREKARIRVSANNINVTK